MGGKADAVIKKVEDEKREAKKEADDAKKETEAIKDKVKKEIADVEVKTKTEVEIKAKVKNSIDGTVGKYESMKKNLLQAKDYIVKIIEEQGSMQTAAADAKANTDALKSNPPTQAGN